MSPGCCVESDSDSSGVGVGANRRRQRGLVDLTSYLLPLLIIDCSSRSSATATSLHRISQEGCLGVGRDSFKCAGVGLQSLSLGSRRLETACWTPAGPLSVSARTVCSTAPEWFGLRRRK